jgi:hypothetical protein
MRAPIASILTLLFLSPLIGTAQEASEEETDHPEPIELDRTSSWKSLKSQDGVEVEYKYSECHDDKNDIHKENVLLRFENTNSNSVKVSWDHLLWYDGTCKTCGGSNEYRFQLELDAKEVRKGDCDLGTPQKVQVFSRFLNPGNGRPDTELSGIQLADLRVE